jgi:O-methyltransferase
VSDDSGLADDYLELVKGALMHTLYAEVDGGINYGRNKAGKALFAHMRQRDIVPVRIGAKARGTRLQGIDWPVFAQTMVGEARIDNLRTCIDDIVRSGVPGDLVEAGVWRGGASIWMKAVLRARGVRDRAVWACDSFEGLPPPDPANPADAEANWHSYKPLSVSLEEVTANFARYRLLDDDVKFVKGWFKDTLPGLHEQTWALIRLDGDMYESTMDGLKNLYPNLSPGGYIVIDDYSGVPACRQAVDEYRASHGIREPIKRIDWTGVYWQREAP